MERPVRQHRRLKSALVLLAIALLTALADMVGAIKLAEWRSLFGCRPAEPTGAVTEPPPKK